MESYAAPKGGDMARGTRLAGTSILVYDDGASCAQMLAGILRASGYAVQIANHFNRALEP